MAASGQRQRAINIGTDVVGARQLSGSEQVVDELPPGFHRADGMRAGGANADFVHVKDADHGDTSEQFVNHGRDGNATHDDDEDVAWRAPEALQCGHMADGVHRHDEEDHGNHRPAQAFDEAEDAGVENGDDPQGDHEECGADFLEFFRLDGLIQQLIDQSFQSFSCTEIVAEERAADGEEGDERAKVGNDGVVKMVGEIGKDRNILCLRLGEVGRGKAKDAAEHEKHDKGDQHHRCLPQRLADFPIRITALREMVRMRDYAAGNCRRMVKGEDQHRDRQPQRRDEIMGGRHLTQNGAVPVRDKIERQPEQDGNQRIHEPVRHLQDKVLVGEHDADHDGDKDTTERGGGAMCIWCSMKEITVLVMPTP